jgi:arylesterase / paraoxonase
MRKIILSTCFLLLVTLLFLTFRTLIKAGTFKNLHPHSRIDFVQVPGMAGAEDITIDRTLGKALVSSYDRRKALAGEPVKGAIYLLDFQAQPPTFADLTADFDQPDFRPHGISLFVDTTDGTKWIFAVNHRESGHFVEIFQFTDSSLVHAESVGSDLFASPNDVAGTGRRQFFFTNDHAVKGGISQFKDFLLIGTGQLGYYDGEQAKILDEGLRYANGVNVSAGGQYLFVALTTNGTINVYGRQPFRKVSVIECGTGVDNLEWDETGNLWAGAHPKMLAFLGHAKDAAKRSPSQILKISFENGPESAAGVTELHLDEGNPFSGSSAAAVSGRYILMGTVFEDGVLVGTMIK